MILDIIYKKIYSNNVIKCIVVWLLLFKYKFAKSQLRRVFKSNKANRNGREC